MKKKMQSYEWTLLNEISQANADVDAAAHEPK
jgi:hypothetical protein